MNKEKHNIFLIDGNSLCYRAFYAIPQLSTSRGEPTNAVYGVVKMIDKILNDHRPGSMAVVFDMPGKTVRHGKYESYKENRPPMPDDLSSQIEKIKEVVRAYGLPVFEKQGFEADDIIATLTRKANDKGFDVTIVTGDKDAFQLVNERVKILSPSPAGDKVYDIEGVYNKFGVSPGQMVDLMALMGDPGDNIPGVRGIGKVTARNLINKFGSLDNVYRNIAEVSPDSLKKKLEAGKELAFLSRELVILDREIPIDRGEIPETLREPDRDALRKIFTEMEFTKLLKGIEPRKKSSITMNVLSSADAMDPLEAMIAESVEISLRLDRRRGGYAVSVSEGSAFYVKIPETGLLRSKAIGLLKDISGDAKKLKIGHDVKEDMRILKDMGIEMKAPFFDVMIADYLVDPSLSSYSLYDIAARRQYDLSEEPAASRGKKAPRVDQTMDFAEPGDDLSVCRMCVAALNLYSPLEKALRERELDGLFYDVEMPLVGVLNDMETAGVGVDLGYLKSGAEKIESELKEIENAAYVLAGEKFNINSPKQIQEILYVKLDLPSGKKIKTGRSTDEDALMKLSSLHGLPSKILEYRRLSKLKTSYYDPILSFSDNSSGILRARFNQAVTSTGRLSSSEPNLQNIPIKTQMGREIRMALRPKISGHVLIAADYSQVELRVLAHLSGDETLAGAFRDNRDVHVFTASLIFGCGLGDVTSEMRDTAKTVNFGIIYGMGAFGLAAALGIEKEKAEDFIGAYFNRYRGVRDFVEKIISKTRETGYVTTLFSRRRYLPEINSSNERVRSFAERAAVNTAVQGTAADIIKMAMIECGKRFRGGKTEMVIQVHDELVFEAPDADLRASAADIKSIMEGVVSLSVPLKVNVESGPNWRDMETVNL